VRAIVAYFIFFSNFCLFNSSL